MCRTLIQTPTVTMLFPVTVKNKMPGGGAEARSSTGIFSAHTSLISIVPNLLVLEEAAPTVCLQYRES
ncbi:hypothetical protein D3C86_2221480 [compost metagenome]